MASVDFHKCKEAKGEPLAMIRHSDTAERLKHNHSNEDIDKSLTPLNKNLTGRSYAEASAYYEDRIRQLDETTNTNKRKDRVPLFALYVPAPEGLNEAEAVAFLRDVHERMTEVYGAENIAASYIHVDEVHAYLDDGKEKLSRIHLHEFVIPEIKGVLNGKRFSSARNMRSINNDLDLIARNVYGVRFMTGEKPKRKTVEELKRAGEAEISRRMEKAAEQEKALAELSAERDREGAALSSLRNDREKEERTLSEIRSERQREETAGELARNRTEQENRKEAEARERRKLEEEKERKATERKAAAEAAAGEAEERQQEQERTLRETETAARKAEKDRKEKEEKLRQLSGEVRTAEEIRDRMENKSLLGKPLGTVTINYKEYQDLITTAHAVKDATAEREKALTMETEAREKEIDLEAREKALENRKRKQEEVLANERQQQEQELRQEREKLRKDRAELEEDRRKFWEHVKEEAKALFEYEGKIIREFIGKYVPGGMDLFKKFRAERMKKDRERMRQQSAMMEKPEPWQEVRREEQTERQRQQEQERQGQKAGSATQGDER